MCHFLKDTHVLNMKITCLNINKILIKYTHIWIHDINIELYTFNEYHTLFKKLLRYSDTILYILE